MNSSRMPWWEWAGLAGCCAAFVLLRMPLYVQPGIMLGWHSDAALLGLMARELPMTFWGCDYLWPLTSLFARGAGIAIGEIGPLALRAGTAIEVMTALLFFHAALRRIAGPRAALLATFWLVAGPAFLFKLTYAPLSAEQYFFTGSIVFWYVARARFTRLHQWLVLGLMAGLGWWIHRGVMFVVVPALAVIVVYDRVLLRRVELAIGAIVFACGAALGYVPVILGKLSLDQRLYIPVTPEWTPALVVRQLASTLRHDLWTLLGGPVAVVLVVLIALAVRRLEWTREFALAAGIVIVAFGFWIFSPIAYQGAVRYIMIVLPILYALAAAAVMRLRWMAARVVLVTAIALALYVPRYQDALAVARGEREVFENWGGFDPRPALREIEAAHYEVCYADVWVAHKLEFLSEPAVRFIPYRSVNRRMTESLRLAALPGRKCFVDAKGNVRALTAAEAQAFRLDTLRLVTGTKP